MYSLGKAGAHIVPRTGIPSAHPLILSKPDILNTTSRVTSRGKTPAVGGEWWDIDVDMGPVSGFDPLDSITYGSTILPQRWLMILDS